MSRTLETLAERYPEVARDLHQDALIAQGDTEGLVASLRAEITDVMTESGWYDSWRDIGSPPDLANVKRGLYALLKSGQADTVIDLCLMLWSYREGPLNNCLDEGETSTVIGECFGVAIEALPQSSLCPAEQLLWEIERCVEDSYGVMLSAPLLTGFTHFTQTHWTEVSDHLVARLAGLGRPHIRDFNTRYARTQLLDATLRALRNAGLVERVIPLLVSEADACQCYAQLVDTLVEAGRIEDAWRWCKDGYERTIVNSPATASGLQQRLRQMASASGDSNLAAAYWAEAFFSDHTTRTYEELRYAAEQAGCWMQTRQSVLVYLETGLRPDRAKQDSGHISWSLPSPETTTPDGVRRTHFKPFPDFDALIGIGLLEGRLQDVLELHARLRHNGKKSWDGTDQAVASAAAATHPDVALTIWRAIADTLIARANPKAYQQARLYLQRMATVLTREGRRDEWEALRVTMRQQHRAKRRLVQILDTL